MIINKHNNMMQTYDLKFKGLKPDELLFQKKCCKHFPILFSNREKIFRCCSDMPFNNDKYFGKVVKVVGGNFLLNQPYFIDIKRMYYTQHYTLFEASFSMQRTLYFLGTVDDNFNYDHLQNCDLPTDNYRLIGLDMSEICIVPAQSYKPLPLVE